jgi:SAM-dependent methyltransferase/uncharacterized protein YbaR (Trm112 family)
MDIMTTPETVDARLLSLLACPRDRAELRLEGRHLCCPHGHKYPIVDGVPVLLLGEQQQTIDIAKASLGAAESGVGYPIYVDTLGLSAEERRGVERDWNAEAKIDAVISYLVGATSGWGYTELVGRLKSYPIPDIPVGEGDGKFLLDVGSNWGRWSISAGRKGWRVIGVDPSLGAILAAQRAFVGQGLDVAFICGDARYLPLKNDLFQCVFSYSVIQHFSEADAASAIAEVGRVLSKGGLAKIQMANKNGMRSTYTRTRRDYLNSGLFRVRYWSLTGLRSIFEQYIGPTTLMAEAFGGLGLLAEDRRWVSNKAKILIRISTVLKRLSTFVKLLIRWADSVYVVSTKQ